MKQSPDYSAPSGGAPSLEGRLTIHVCKDCGQRAHYQDRCPKDRRRIWTEMVEVPIVPCDDAAIERGAAALIAIAARWGLGEWHIEGARELAEAVLRAAGETDG